jgi:hypothetical protein
MFDKDTLYILGTARVSGQDPIKMRDETFFIGLVVKEDTGEIIDATCNMVRELTTDFIRSIVVGYKLVDDLEGMIQEVDRRFHGLAKRAVIASLRDAKNRYQNLTA